MKYGLLTGGGDAPGLNGIIEAVSRTLLGQGHEVVGSLDGFEGIFSRNFRPIRSVADVTGLHGEAGTFLGTSNKSRIAGREAEFLEGYRAMGVAGLIVAGGDGTFAALSTLGRAVPVVGVPKTIDNDLAGTEITFGFDTACSVVAEAVDALRQTAEAHRRIMVVEAMGRTAGWIALGAGLASYADAILIPERPPTREAFLDFVHEQKRKGRRGLVIVACESAHFEGEDAKVAFTVPGSVQAERYGGVSQAIAHWVEQETEWESRAVILGHLQRAAPPTTTDRFLTVAMGVEAARLAMESQWNHAVVYRCGQVERAPLAEVQGPARRVPADHRWVQLAEELGIFI